MYTKRYTKRVRTAAPAWLCIFHYVKFRVHKHFLNNKVGGVFAQAWPPPCRFFLLLPLPPSPFQAHPLEHRGSPSLLTCPGFRDPCKREPKAGHFRYSSGCLWPNVDGASSLSGTLLVFHLNQVNQPLVSTHFPTTLFLPNLILYLQINKFFLAYAIPTLNYPGSTGAGPWQD